MYNDSFTFLPFQNFLLSINAFFPNAHIIGKNVTRYADRLLIELNQRKKTNVFYAHLDKNEGHELDWENASFIDSEKFWKGRKVKESLYISAQNPSKVVDAKVILNLEKGLELDPMWGFFNEQFRRTMEEKIPMGAKL